MKWIKIFEDFNEYYSEISQTEWTDMIRYTTYTWDKSEINKIESLYDDSVKVIETDSISHRFDEYPPNSLLVLKSKKSLIGRIVPKKFSNFWESVIGKVVIYKMMDDWFAVWSHGDQKYYKCDQFDGLVKCLKDIGLKLISTGTDFTGPM